METPMVKCKNCDRMKPAPTDFGPNDGLCSMCVSKPKVLSRGYTVSSSVYFEWITPIKPTVGEVSDAQARAGFHPGGYGGPDSLKSVEQEDRTWKSTWTCWGNCD